MSSYSTQTVAQLKELLKSKGLSTAGVKAELVARMEEADQAITESKNEEVTPVEEKKVVEVKPVEDKQKEPVVEEKKDAEVATSAETTTEEKKSETEAEAPKKVKEMTPEERKVAALELLNKKLKRSQKFGGDDVEDLKKQIDRVEKFGVDPGTTLAKEIGIGHNEGLTERKGFGRKGRRFSKGRRGDRFVPRK